MADLKNTNEGALVESVQRAEKSGIEDVHVAAREAIQAVRDVAAALKELPPRADDLIARAELAEVFSTEVSVEGELRYGELRIATDRGDSYMRFGRKQMLSPGRKRVLLFILPEPK